MAYIPCIIGGGGGQYTETSLWTNASPSSDYSGGTVTLSESVDNFKYIKVTLAYNKSNLTITGSEIISVEDLKKAPYPATGNNVGFYIGNNSASNNYARRIQYINGTSVNISSAYLITSATGSVANSQVIPLEILGLNELDTGTKTWDSGTIPYNSSSTTKITLGYKPKILILRYYKSTSAIIDNIYTDSISTSAYQRWVYSGSASMVTRTLPRGTSESRCITSIDNDGFTVGPNDDNTYTCYYWTTGES